jgi:cytoskeletal protein CcmA (bactofilin family)
MATFRPEEEDSVYIGHGAELTGAIKARGSVVIDGSFDGEIDCNHFLVGASGNVKGKILVSTAEISGHVDAEITATELLAVRATGRVEGKWDCGALEVTRGGVLIGTVHVSDRAGEQRMGAGKPIGTGVEFVEEEETPAPPRKVTKLNLRTPRRSVG